MTSFDDVIFRPIELQGISEWYHYYSCHISESHRAMMNNKNKRVRSENAGRVPKRARMDEEDFDESVGPFHSTEFTPLQVIRVELGLNDQPEQIHPLASAIFDRASATARSSGKVKRKNFRLLVKVRMYLHEEDREQWTTFDLGTFNAGEFEDKTSSEEIQDIMWDRFQEFKLHYGMTMSTIGYSLMFTDLEYGVEGGCDNRQGISTIMYGKHKLISYFSKNNECGPRILLRFLKKHQSRWNPSLYKKHGKTITSLRKLDGVPPNKGEMWSTAHLQIVCDLFDVNLIVYALDAIGSDTPIRGKEDGRLTVRIVYSPQGSMHYAKHYLELAGECDFCKRCKQSMISKWKHRCEVTCEFCFEKYEHSNSRHLCAMEEKDISDSASAQARMQEVELILAGKFDDAARVKAWRGNVEQGMSTALFGDAGTGKTYQVIQYITEKIQNKELSPSQVQILCSESCGTRAYSSLGSTVSARTIHAFLNIYPDCNIKSHSNRLLSNKNKAKVKKDIMRKRLIIVDEIGNCPPKLFEDLNYVLSCLHQNGASFGGVQLIVTGDFNQRPPIEEDRKQPPLFMTKLWERLNLRVTKLRQQRRLQAKNPCDKTLLKAQLLCSRGILDTQTRTELNKNHCTKDPSVYELQQDVTYLVNNNNEVFDIGYRKIRQFHTSDTIERYSCEYVQNKKLSPNVKYDPNLYVSVGVPVMFTTNTYKEASNGTMGKVVSHSQENIVVSLDYNPKLHVAVRREKFPGTVRQFPIRLAYARTTSKSQGATLGKVCLTPCVNSTAVACAYVGISRTRSAQDLWFTRPLRNDHIVISPLANAYMSICEEVDYANIRSHLETLKGMCKNPYAANCTVFDTQIISSHRGTYIKPLQLWKRSSPLAPENPLHVFNHVLFFDLETSQDPLTHTEEAYSVYAKYWVKNKMVKSFQHAFDEQSGNLKPDCMGSFVRWMMEEILLPLCQDWVDSNFKNKSSVKLMAYNGSGFDFQFVLREMMHRAKYSGIEMSLQAMSGARLMCGDLVYKYESKRYKCLSFWDPCLLAANTLDGAHKAFCPGKHILVEKDVFPHKWIKKVGAESAFATKGLVELDIKTSFFANMWSVVREKIAECALQAGSMPDSVLFDLRKEHDAYIEKDVVLMEDVYEALSQVMFDFLPGENLLPCSFPTLASFSFYAANRLLPGECIEMKDKSGRIKTKIYRMNMRMIAMVRMGVYGGRTLNRALKFVSAQYEQVKAATVKSTIAGKQVDASRARISKCKADLARFLLRKRVDDGEGDPELYYKEILAQVSTIAKAAEEEKDPYSKALQEAIREHNQLLHKTAEARAEGQAAYNSLDDALFYLDVNGMYHDVMQQSVFPYGQHQEFTNKNDCAHLLNYFRTEADDCTMPMFMIRLDLYPNEHDVEASIPHRGGKGRLMWDNTPKLQQVYSSVHIKLALDRGYRVCNPTWAVVWGQLEQDTGKWIGAKAKIFASLMEKCEAERKLGGGRKTFGKGTANRNFGAWTKRDFNDSYRVFSTIDGVFEDVEDMLNLYRDGSLECRYHQSYKRDDGEHIVVSNWRAKAVDDEELGKRAPWIGAFVLAYAHRMIDDMIEKCIDRRSGQYTNQVYNGDTDSIFLHCSSVNVDVLPIHLKRLGALSDDLDDYYSEPETDAAGELIPDSQGRPRFAKIVRMACPAKKMYGVEFVTPDGVFHRGKPKSKGLAKGMSLNKMTGIEWEAFKKPFNERLASSDIDVRSAARRELDKAVEAEGDGFVDQLTIDDLFAAVDAPEQHGVVGSSLNWKSFGPKPAPHKLRAGNEFFSKENIVMKRQILADGAQFPPERMLVQNQSDSEHVIWSVPQGWKKKPDGCLCYACRPVVPS